MLKDERDALWAENTSLRERIGLLTTDYENMRFENHWMKQYILLSVERVRDFFVGKDVAQALGYTNTRDALNRHVDEEDKTTVGIHDGGSNYTTRVIVINERESTSPSWTK